jgi:hypothetical protein
MELRLTQAAAVQVITAWAAYLEANPGIRAVEGGGVKLDSAPQASPYVPAMDGSTVIAWYKADPTAEVSAQAIAEANMATNVMGLPRTLYVGKLIDIRRGANGAYLKLRTITRLTAGGAPAYRTFNPAKGQLIELIVNPTPADLSSAMGGQEPA